MKKNIKLKRIIIFTLILLVLLTTGVFAFVGLENFGNNFSIENGISTNLDNVAGIVKGKLKFIYTEREDLTKPDGTLNVIETTSEDDDDASEPFVQDTNANTRNKLRYVMGGYKKDAGDTEIGSWAVIETGVNPAEPDTIDNLMKFLNGHKNTKEFCGSDCSISVDPTAQYGLRNFNNLYCVYLGRETPSYHKVYKYKYNTSIKFDVSRKFNILNIDDTVPQITSFALTEPDYFEGSNDNEAAINWSEGFGLVYPSSFYPGFFTVSGITNSTASAISGINNESVYTKELNSTKMRNMFLGNSGNKLPNIEANLGGGIYDPDPGTPKPATRNKYNVWPENTRELNPSSNATYFYYGKGCDGNNLSNYNPINLYNFDNDGHGNYKDTNTYSYGTAFSEKFKTTPKYWERAQATIWAGTGGIPPKMDPAVAASTNQGKFDHIDDTKFDAAEFSVMGEELDWVEGDDDSEVDETESTTAKDYNPNQIVLYMAGRALDEYEYELARDYGGKNKSAHDMAVKGSTVGVDDKLKNKVIVSTKEKDAGFNPSTDAGTIKDATGTTIFEEGGEKYFKIGPFEMSNYTYAGSKYIQFYSGAETDKYRSLIGGIVSGELTFSYDDSSKGDVKVQVGESRHGEVKAQIVYDSPRPGPEEKGNDSYIDSPDAKGNQFLQDVDDLLSTYEDGLKYEFPRPESKFYIKIKVSDCQGAETLKNIRFVYRQTYSDGDGWIIASRYVKSQWKAQATGPDDGCSTYSCDNVPSKASTAKHDHDKGTHSYSSCDGKRGDGGIGGGASLTHHDNCSNCTCCQPNGCTHTHCGPCPGTAKNPCNSGCHCGRCSGFTCSQKVYCTHGYRWCLETTPYTYVEGSAKVKKGQPMLALHKTKVDLRDYCYDAEVYVRLTTDVTINKYIYDVEHYPDANNNDTLQKSGYNSTYPEAIMDELGQTYDNVSREKLSENEKQNNPVYVEYGDIVTYHIQLINKQKKDITVKVFDTLPKNAVLLSIQNITPTLNTNGVTNAAGITSNAFKPQREFADGSDTSLDVLLQSGKYDVAKEDVEPVYEKFSKEQYFTTDWIGVPGKKGSDESNIVTLAIRIRVNDWENSTGTKWENNVRIITRNSGPKGTFKSNDYVEDYMRVVDNGLPMNELETERDKHSKYPPSTTFPLPNTIHGPVVNIAELDPNVDNKDAKLPQAKKLESSDWYILNNYNAFMDKHVYKYNEIMQQMNEQNTYTSDGYVSSPRAGTPSLVYADMGNDDVLVKPRANTNDTMDTQSVDGNIRENRREPGDSDSVRYNEKSKKIHPVSVEKTETIIYAVKVSNEAKIANKTTDGVMGTGHISGSKPATQARTTKVTDYLEHGLKYMEIKAIIYDENNQVVSRYGSNTVPVNVNEMGDVTIDGRTYKVYEYEIDDKTILNPGDYIVYFVTVEITESNMYLKDLENTANITVLTNINTKEDKSRVVRNKNEFEASRKDGRCSERDENIALQEVSSDWVRLKDLVISGRVWVDFDRDGYMNENVTETYKNLKNDPYDKIKNSIKDYYSVDEYGRKKEVTVKLYRSDTNQLLRTTKTDDTGLYTFGRKEDGASYYNEYNYEEVPGHSVEFSSNETYQRVDKAEHKDSYGNYKDNAKYIDYYVEFEYDGVIYKSTEFYSGDDNINRTEHDDNFGRYDLNGTTHGEYDAREGRIHNDDGTGGESYTYKYEVDSNAAEFRDVRQAYNRKYEYISYNVAYAHPGLSSSDSLQFDKTDHTSQLMEQDSRKTMTARSFINNATLAGTHNSPQLPSDPNSYNWDDDGISVDSAADNSTTQLLWLCKYNPQDYTKEPETEYLKHINLGLELKDDADIALTKDVYQVKTTINGEEMVYTYDENNGLNGNMETTGNTTGGSEDSKKAGYLNDYIVEKPYGLELYESDYKYRFEQYKADAVRKYKGEESELNIEVTYRITVNNKSVSDDDNIKENRGQNSGKPDVKDTKLDIKLHEVLDLYDQNFKEVQFDNSGKIQNINDDNITITDETSGTNNVTVRTKDENGYLVDKKLIIGEAWYFKEDSNGNYVIENEVTNDANKKAAESGSAKPVYKEIDGTFPVPTGATKYSKKYLTLKGTSNGYSDCAQKKNDFKADGYHTLYIECMDPRTTDADNEAYFTIPEGEERDIYVKYIVDKTSISENVVTKDGYSEATAEQVKTIDEDGHFKTTVVETSASIKNVGTTIERSLKIAERITSTMKEKFGRGTENIAQVNAYSVWYQHNKLPASIVDMDSNVGNIGDENDKKSDQAQHTDSADNIDLYEDTAYKTGIEIVSNGTENTEDTVKNKNYVVEIVFNNITGPITRSISGMVWDDSRSEELGEDASKKQYAGNGIYNDGDSPNSEAKINENVEVNYKDESVTEDTDIKVRGANAEYVEIVQLPSKTMCKECNGAGGDCKFCTGTEDTHYYEEILSNVTWVQTQHTRTDNDGKYTLTGFMPGKYIVRFTYGDEVDNGANQNDMYVFNGQDYKTTKYAYDIGTYAQSEQGSNSTANLAKVTATENTIDEYATANTKVEKDDLQKIAADTVLAALERPNLSDARDDEVRRLEVNNYSEIMVNSKAEVLKGVANGKLTSKGVYLPTDDKNGDPSGVVNYYYDNPRNIPQDAGIVNTPEQLKELTDNTYMYAETVEFLVKAEKLTYGQTTGSYYAKFNSDAETAEGIQKIKDVYYDNLRNIEFNTVANRNFKIENVDMGIEYRPETNIGLIKEINRIKLVTSDNETLVDLPLKTEYGEFGKILRHYVDLKNAKGAELVQFITNQYDRNALLQNVVQVDDEDLQGFMYINVDDDVLQGCKVIVQYKFVAQNNSEVDRVSNTLNDMRFYGNDRTQYLKNKAYSDEIADTSSEFFLNNVTAGSVPGGTATFESEYTANHFARNIVHSDVYKVDENSAAKANVTDAGSPIKDVYRNRAKTMINDLSNEKGDNLLAKDKDDTNGYFGKYAGYTYYTSKIDEQLEGYPTKYNDAKVEIAETDDVDIDVIAELKFDRIIDYVDTDLEFGQLSQEDMSKLAVIGSADSAGTPGETGTLEGEETSNNPLLTSVAALKNALLNDPINSDIGSNINQAFSNISLKTAQEYSIILNPINKALKKAFQSITPTPAPGGEDPVTPTPNTNPLNATAIGDILTDLEGIKYKAIVVTVPDRQRDDPEDVTVNNKAFSKFLLPSVLDEENQDITSIAEIVLPVSKVMATETDTDDMRFENIAEVVQFTVLTGRRTNFDTTIGNADIHTVDKQLKKDQNVNYEAIGSIEFVTSALEPDTASTETITLAPPTGLMRNRVVIRNAVEATRDVLEITVIAVAVVVVLLFVTKFTLYKIKKRRYK